MDQRENGPAPAQMTMRQLSQMAVNNMLVKCTDEARMAQLAHQQGSADPLLPGTGPEANAFWVQVAIAAALTRIADQLEGLQAHASAPQIVLPSLRTPQA